MSPIEAEELLFAVVFALKNFLFSPFWSGSHFYTMQRLFKSATGLLVHELLYIVLPTIFNRAILRNGLCLQNMAVISKEGESEMGKIIAVLFISLLYLGSTACTKRVFGVPEDHWYTLTQEQQTEVIRAYNEREKINAERRLAAQRQAAEDAEAQRLLTEAEAKRVREHVDDIYAGRAGVYGDLVRVTIKNAEGPSDDGRHDILPQSSFLWRTVKKSRSSSRPVAGY